MAVFIDFSPELGIARPEKSKRVFGVVKLTAV